MKIDSLESLYVEQLQDLYSAEEQLIEALPKMARASSSAELRNAFEQHLEQTKRHRDRLNQIMNDMNLAPASKKCKGMAGLIEEGEEVVEASGDPAAIDAALIAAAQRVEHYEIAGYGTVRTYAQELGYDSAADTLQRTLNEESQANEKLTRLATEGIRGQALNVKAMQS